MLTCEDVVGLLLEYLEEAMSADVVDELERHLQDCPPCRAYLNTYRRTRELAGQAADVPMPPEMKARLREFLVRQLATGSS